jgi:aminomethyltransferase
VDVWDSLVAAGEPLGAIPAGLGARDTLRTEMGYPLHGQDISPTITPVEARLGWAIGWDKAEFCGRNALIAVRREPGRRLRGLRSVDRAIPRAHMAVSNAEGVLVGEVTSGTFSPTLKVGIALALVDSSISDGDDVVVDVRGKPARFTVMSPPFVESRPK